MFAERDVVQVACGLHHGLILLWDGTVLSWGRAYHGHGHSDLVPKPTLLHFDEKIRSISCGRNHSLVITQAGNVFAWGDSANGKLGYDTDDPDSHLKPFPIRLRVEVLHAACGAHHTILVTKTGNILACGDQTHLPSKPKTPFEFTTVRASPYTYLTLEEAMVGAGAEYSAALVRCDLQIWGRFHASPGKLVAKVFCGPDVVMAIHRDQSLSFVGLPAPSLGHDPDESTFNSPTWKIPKPLANPVPQLPGWENILLQGRCALHAIAKCGPHMPELMVGFLEHVLKTGAAEQPLLYSRTSDKRLFSHVCGEVGWANGLKIASRF